MSPRLALVPWVTLAVACSASHAGPSEAPPDARTESDGGVREACDRTASWAATVPEHGHVDHLAVDALGRAHASVFGRAILALDSEGNLRWSAPWSVTLPPFSGNAFAVAADGSVYMIGDASIRVVAPSGEERRRVTVGGTLRAIGVVEGSGVVVLLETDGRLFVASLTADLVEAWRTDVGDGPPAGTTGPHLAVAPDGRSAFAWRGHVGALSETGELAWAHDVPAREMHAVDIAPGGSVAIGGVVDGDADFGGGPLGMSWSFDAFVAVYGPDGGHHWSRALRSETFDYTYGLAFRGDGGLVVTGHFGEGGPSPSHLDLGDGVPLVSLENDRDVFVGAYDRLGMLEWARSVPDEGEAAGRAVAVGPCGDVIIGGFFDRGIDLDGHVLTMVDPDALWAPFVWRFVPE